MIKLDYRTLQSTGNVNATVAFREPLNLVTKKLTTVNKASLTGELNGEIASRSRSMDFWAMGAMLPNPDDVLKKLGLDIRVYESLKKDASVGGAIRRRKSAVKAMERGFRDDSNPKVNELLDSVFEKLALDRGQPISTPMALLTYPCVIGRWYLKKVDSNFG